MMKERLKVFGNPLFLTLLLIIMTVIITGQSYLLKHDTFQESGKGYTHYNNYVIFKQSFFHLVENKDLYHLYPEEHWDYYKYSPAFALLMAPLAVLPDALGLFFWNLLNVLVLFFALWKLPIEKKKIHLLMFAAILIELITSIQNAQSNGLIAGFILFAFIFMEKRKPALASLLIVLAIFIKIFGLVAFALYILYPGKIKASLYSAGWFILLTFLPLMVISWSQLIVLYQSWFHLLQMDQGISWGLSVSGWLHSWFGTELKTSVMLTGILLFCLPFLRYRCFDEAKFRLTFLCSILIWIVIFNHKAESPTYVIAFSGVVIWFISRKISPENLVLFILAIVFTVLSPTDIFPHSVRVNWVIPYFLKAVPCILVWLKITCDLLLYKSGQADSFQ